MVDDAQSIDLIGWHGPWSPDDPDANFKADVALYAHVNPMTTINQLSATTNIPEGGLVHYVLARWASQGSGGLLEIGPSMVNRLWATVEKAEGLNTSEARLVAFEELRQMISWLRLPLEFQNEGSDDI